MGGTWNVIASLKIDNADDNLRLLNPNFIKNSAFSNFYCQDSGQKSLRSALKKDETPRGIEIKFVDQKQEPRSFKELSISYLEESL